VISSKNVNVRVPETTKAPGIGGEEDVYSVLGYPLGIPNLKQATDKAFESAGPGYNALVDGVVFAIRKWYLLFGIIGYSVEGTSIKTEAIRN
jgi:hypothetical protein